MSAPIRFTLFWLTSLATALAFIYLAFGQVDEDSFEDAALGEQTESFIGQLEGDRVHCRYLDEEGEECVTRLKARSPDRVTLWLGNSQLHAINQPKPRDELSSVQIARALRPKDIDLIAYSQPNANLQEHLVMFEAISSRVMPDILLLPAVFDDTREGLIRAQIRDTVHEPDVTAALETSEIGRSILSAVEKADVEPDDGAKTIQDRSEAAITDFLHARFGWEELRRKVRGTIGRTLYYMRNTAFGITPSSVRKKIPSTYTGNMAAMKQLLRSTAQKDVAVIVYIPPIRSDVKRPYNPQEYETFKQDVKDLARAHSVHFANLEDIVPGPLWGTKRSTSLDREPEYDFMHFQAGGHDLLAEHLLREIGKLYP